MGNYIFENREISWLSFNYRVLQEAKDKSNPLYERIKFLAIYSSNLDEFFRVRVASLRSLLRLKKKSTDELDFEPAKLLKDIHAIVNKQQEEYGEIFRNQIIPELHQKNICLVDTEQLNEEQRDFLEDYFQVNIIQYIEPIPLVKSEIPPFLRNGGLYFVVKLSKKNDNKNKDKQKKKYAYELVQIPSQHLSRFVILPSDKEETRIIFLDDIIKFNLQLVFPGYKVENSYSVKLTRDAELYIEDEFTGNLLNKIKKGLSKRSTGVPSRFLYDKNMPDQFLKFVKSALQLGSEDIVPGGKYHNFDDFFDFPNPGFEHLEYKPLIPLKHKGFENSGNLFEAIKESDKALFFPYQTYNYVIELLSRAAEAPEVTSIKITQYRVAKDSEIINSLIKAVKNKKEVIVFVELKARFDEERNIKWAEEMEKAGIKVYYSFPGLKVHAKIALVTRKENGKPVKYAYLGTGNFNEKTAKIYSDFGLFTYKEEITKEIENVFEFLSNKKFDYKFNHILVAQFNMRDKFTALIENEIELAGQGKKAKITLKMNSLEDKKMIKKLYEASNAGVRIDIIIRGICCLVPGVKGQSENINVISILDRYLEHARIYIFNNDGDEKIYCASADWMKRNLSRRVEVGFPVYDENIKQDIKHIINLQLKDSRKARIIDKGNLNRYLSTDSDNKISSQETAYNYFMAT
ncbi:MAG: polyphosphate kinase 1 [Ignavibacteria bacterium]|jgi:polyphosphate kinase